MPVALHNQLSKFLTFDTIAFFVLFLIGQKVTKTAIVVFCFYD